ncbi:hypothetical protein [Pararhodospirillum oryzae]|uniref:hypothetical protein n=1 Tax=Pararhodospirillum oryzae TaxID=478448 RepID=UPI0014797492|nr:hypothetical protein [Pararhodospirillum oryzae]
MKTIDIECLPVQEPRGPKEVPKQTRVRFKSRDKFFAARPVPVFLTPGGVLKWKPPVGN